MSLENWVSVFEAVGIWIGSALVILQMRDSAKQRQAESLVEIYDINRQLLSLGFEHPKLFRVLEDAKDTDPVSQRRYLQLWLNQFALIHFYLKNSGFDIEQKESLVRDLSDFFTQENMQRHWKEHGSFYPESFQELVNGIIKKMSRQ